MYTSAYALELNIIYAIWRNRDYREANGHIIYYIPHILYTIYGRGGDGLQKLKAS